MLGSFNHAARPDVSTLPFARRIDLGPDADRGIGRWAVGLGEPHVNLVSAVDDDGTEVAGARLPAVAAPAVVYIGWNAATSTACRTYAAAVCGLPPIP